ncbi:hypothetical protein NDU88_005153 [Pleurodeles waltl]|uniref:Uncharacterized protein n=1 Tax=Pleurodeles waltl TaxID=8319 RepID=A0AAV7L0E6_PLEWA|nr:hypothetical protein NDU88_005153 [Pleurodeles waltl]
MLVWHGGGAGCVTCMHSLREPYVCYCCVGASPPLPHSDGGAHKGACTLQGGVGGCRGPRPRADVWRFVGAGSGDDGSRQWPRARDPSEGPPRCTRERPVGAGAARSVGQMTEVSRRAARRPGAALILRGAERGCLEYSGRGRAGLLLRAFSWDEPTPSHRATPVLPSSPTRPAGHSRGACLQCDPLQSLDYNGLPQDTACYCSSSAILQGMLYCCDVRCMIY